MSVLSLVVPCYNEEETIPIYYREVCRVENRINARLEFCFVDDGSNDRTLSVLRDLSKKDERVHYVSFSRNFGKEAGLLAGLELATGDYVVTMDVDLQDPPSLLPEMFDIVSDPDNGYDSVATRRSTREGEPVIRSFFARKFYKLINRMSTTHITDGSRDYRMMTRQMVNAVISDREYNRFSKGLYSWVGFKTKWLEYENIERSAGTTKWSFTKLFKYAIEGILAYTTEPLAAGLCAGVAMILGSLIAIICLIVHSAVHHAAFLGFPSILCFMILIGGMIMTNTGIASLYVSRIYLETKKRQVYIIKEKA